MISRNRALVRSVVFGGLTKVGGGLVLLLGLPLIAHGLSLDAYAAFLKAMTLASIVTLAFGAAGTVSVREIAKALKGTPDQLRAAERQTFGLFAILATTAILICATVLPFNLAGNPHAGVISLAALLVLLQGLAQWGEVYRVASRTDHLSSLWQLAGNVSVLLLLLAFSGSGLLPIVLIYFAVPMAVQIAVFLQLMVQRGTWVSPGLAPRAILGNLLAMIPVAGNSLADYAKIFLSGLVVSHVAGAAEYGLYMTLVLIVARLVNPLSLVTRPLMPAYLDALHHHDRRWLNGARWALLVCAGAGLLGGAALAFTLDPSLLRAIIPEKLGDVSRMEIVSVTLFLWGHSLTTLMTPLFYAAHKDRLLGAVNGGFVGLGLIAGGTLALADGAAGMLAVMAGASALTALTLLCVAAFRLLATRPNTSDPACTAA